MADTHELARNVLQKDGIWCFVTCLVLRFWQLPLYSLCVWQLPVYWCPKDFRWVYWSVNDFTWAFGIWLVHSLITVCMPGMFAIQLDWLKYEMCSYRRILFFIFRCTIDRQKNKDLLGCLYRKNLFTALRKHPMAYLNAFKKIPEDIRDIKTRIGRIQNGQLQTFTEQQEQDRLKSRKNRQINLYTCRFVLGSAIPMRGIVLGLARILWLLYGWYISYMVNAAERENAENIKRWAKASGLGLFS